MGEYKTDLRDINQLIFEVREKRFFGKWHKYKIYANGRVEGFKRKCNIVNLYPILIYKAVQFNPRGKNQEAI